MKRWTVFILLLFSVAAYADDSANITKPSVNLALKRLATTDVFAFGPAGYSGSSSQGEADFNVIMGQAPNTALEIFQRLYTTGNPQAKSYALVGIRKLNGNRFSDLLVSLETPDQMVKTQSGCIVGHQSLRAIAEQIKRGAYDHRP